MFFIKRKKIEEVEIPKKVSDEAIYFIKKYAIHALNLSLPLNEDSFCEVLAFADECELNMIDPLSKYGSDKDYDYPEKERDILGDKFVSETSAYLIDLEDLNERLKEN